MRGVFVLLIVCGYVAVVFVGCVFAARKGGDSVFSRKFWT